LPRPERSNSITKHQAIKLRKESTPAEQRLWWGIRNDQLGVTFRRHTCPGGRCQGHAIGGYIPDFCCPKVKLVIELDGSQHLEQKRYDKERTAYLESKGYQVIRFWNNDVMNDIDSVIRAIPLRSQIAPFFSPESITCDRGHYIMHVMESEPLL
jgi:very-short-patch-repair endonuclease